MGQIEGSGALHAGGGAARKRSTWVGHAARWPRRPLNLRWCIQAFLCPKCPKVEAAARQAPSCSLTPFNLPSPRRRTHPTHHTPHTHTGTFFRLTPPQHACRAPSPGAPLGPPAGRRRTPPRTPERTGACCFRSDAAHPEDPARVARATHGMYVYAPHQHLSCARLIPLSLHPPSHPPAHTTHTHEILQY